MRLRTTVIAICQLIGAAPAFSASQKDHDDCNSENAERDIAGCKRIINDTTESDKVRGIAHVGQGLAWQGKGERDKALADFTDAIRINPKPRSDMAGSGHVNIYTNRGLAWHAKDDLDRALADFDQAISLDASDIDAWFHRGRVHFAKHALESAVADFDKVIRLEPRHTSAYYLRGASGYDQYMSASAWIRKTDLEGAIADFTEAIRLAPTLAILHYARGLANTTNGDRDHAITDLIEAVRLYPGNTEFLAALKQLKPDYEVPKDPLEKMMKWAPLQTKAQ